LWYECEGVKKSLQWGRNIEEELKTHKAQTRFIFKNPLKGTYNSQNLGKGKGFEK